MKREEKRKRRQDELQDYIKESNHGGRGLPSAAHRQEQEALREKQKKDAVLKEREKFQRMTEHNKKRVEETKKQNMDELQEARIEDMKGAAEQRVQAEQDRKGFMKKQKQKITQEFQDNYKRRDAVL
jgi:hypothetical protein